MKSSLILLICAVGALSYAQSPSNVVIDGVEYVPLQNNVQDQNYTIPDSSLRGVESCWYEQVPVVNNTVVESPNIAAAIIGGVVGGVVGHQFGSGVGKTAATIGGAALGTTMGSSVPQSAPPGYQTVRKCNISR
jgi:uncharacterized protein YcfJ